MTFRQIPITVNTDTRKIVDPATLQPQASLNGTSFGAGEVVVFCVSFVDNSNTAVAIGASDTFNLYVDKDFTRTLQSGTLGAGLSGTVTEAVINGLLTAPSESGSLNVQNSAGDSERFIYTAATSSGSAYVFTGSAVLTHVYLAGDVASVNDPLMAESATTSVDIPGDWTAINRTTGKVSIRTYCNSPTFYTKVGTTGTKVNGYLQIDRFPGTGNPDNDSSTMLFDTVQLCNSLKQTGSAAPPSSWFSAMPKELTLTSAPTSATTLVSIDPSAAAGSWGWYNGELYMWNKNLLPVKMNITTI